ncbi:thiamine diphosphokinase [Oceanobacillus limi]|uniref:Thiamine diphosphokinase n=1 Tax=Oceanobacillus limi TaxID=930131 RepID=A0A1I0HC21_9BACI|nr:thiamine diphosphokinase [Oceanobacillus limi]SET81188.1 thiamine diphosphokinase [Oceanobacillus limi]
MMTIGIVGNGPTNIVPDLSLYMNQVDYWIGADRGALTILNQHMKLDCAIGDFDSLEEQEKISVQQRAEQFTEYPEEKDETDVEIALQKAIELNPAKIVLFAVTGGRMDHTLANIQLLLAIKNRKIDAAIIDQQNCIELFLPGTYRIDNDEHYPNLSFIPVTQQVKGLTLKNFYYPLTDETIYFGSTRSISNKLLLNYGTFSHEEGILLLIKSRDLK